MKRPGRVHRTNGTCDSIAPRAGAVVACFSSREETQPSFVGRRTIRGAGGRGGGRARDLIAVAIEQWQPPYSVNHTVNSGRFWWCQPTPPRFLRPFRWLRDVTPCVRAGAAFRYSGVSRSLLLVLYASVMGAKYYEMSLRSFLGHK